MTFEQWFKNDYEFNIKYKEELRQAFNAGKAVSEAKIKELQDTLDEYHRNERRYTIP